MIAPESYLSLHDLWSLENLQQECERSGVRIVTSPSSPTTVMLHYTEETQFDKKWNNFNRMCRGLILDLANRKVLAYPFDKFFNLDEMPETKYNVLEELGAFEVTEKLDGSMLVLYRDPTTKELRLTTKGSFTSDHGVYATSIMPQSWQQLGDGLLERYTFVFELISSKFPIVIDYRKKGYTEGLYLIGVRDRYQNIMLPHNQVEAFAIQFGVNPSKTYSFASLDELIDNVKGLTVLEEGYVLRYENRFVKVKGQSYLAAHRFISHLSRKSILEALGLGTAKDLLAIAPEEYRADVEKEIELFQKHKFTLVNILYEQFSKAPKDSRKEFALWVQQSIEPDLKGFMFTLLDNKPLDDKKIYALIGVREGVTGETKI